MNFEELNKRWYSKEGCRQWEWEIKVEWNVKEEISFEVTKEAGNQDYRRDSKANDKSSESSDKE